jgi:hypothetical protein
MRKLPFVLSAAIAFAASAAAPASASGPSQACTTAPESQWLKIAEIQAKLEEQGYRVAKAKFKKSCGEIYATDKAGQRVELFVDPTSARIAETKKVTD